MSGLIGGLDGSVHREPAAKPAPSISAVPAALKTPRVSRKKQARQVSVDQFLSLAAIGVGAALRQPADAEAIRLHGPAVGSAVVDLADVNPALAKILDDSSKSNLLAYLTLVMAAAPLIAQLMVNHNVVKPEQIPVPGVVSKDALLVAAEARAATIQEMLADIQAEADDEGNIAMYVEGDSDE